MTQITIENYIRDLEDEFIYGLGEPEIVEKCNQLTNIIKTEFDDFEAYKINSKVDNGLRYPYYNSFKIAIGRTEINNYIGISPSLHIINKKIFEKELVRFFEDVQQEDLYLKQKINLILRELSLPIKSEFDNVQNTNNIVEIYSNKNVLIEQILQKSNAVKISYLHYFESEGLEDEGLEKYLDFNIFIQKYLKNIKLYEIGFSEYIYIYVIGETPTGDWLGISTKASKGD